MQFWADLRVLYRVLFCPIRGQTHRERLEGFYRQQAEVYDSFRVRLLQGRRELWESLPTPNGGVWADLGGGTAFNLEYLGERIRRLGHIYVVDLADSLLDVANRRIAARGWTNVETVSADAARFEPCPSALDVITFSYSLTMMPDWFAVLENVRRILKPGGIIGVVDFYVSRKYPQPGHVRHRWWTRTFWPTWFAADNVLLNADHVPYLHRYFEPIAFTERRAKVPYFPLGRVPYYCFIGRKRTDDGPHPHGTFSETSARSDRLQVGSSHSQGRLVAAGV